MTRAQIRREKIKQARLNKRYESTLFQTANKQIVPKPKQTSPLSKPEDYYDIDYRTTRKVAVTMTNYNYIQFLSEAIESILNQTFWNFDFLILDDGSTDGSWEMLIEYQKLDSRIKLFRHAKPMGICKSLNDLIYYVSGITDYIAHQDSDDISLPERLEKQVEFLDANPDYLLCGCIADIYNQKINKITSLPRPITDEQCTKFHYHDKSNSFIHSSMMFRVDFAKKIGGYDEAFTSSEDFDFGSSAIRLGKVCNLPEKLMLYRAHGQNLCATQGGTTLNNFKKMSLFKNFCLLNGFKFHPKDFDINASLKEEKKKILFVGDLYEWAFNNEFNNITKYLTDYDCDYYPCYEKHKINPKWQDYDLIYIYDPYCIGGVPISIDRKRIILQISSDYGYIDDPSNPRQLPRDCKKAGKLLTYPVIHTLSEYHFNQFKDFHPNVISFSQGIDEKKFSLKDPETFLSNEKLMFGWVGRKRTPVKNYDLIKKVFDARKDVELKEAHTIENGNKPTISNDLMPDFYKNIDVLIGASSIEGCSMVVLEAASTGLPIAFNLAPWSEIYPITKGGYLTEISEKSLNDAIDFFKSKTKEQLAWMGRNNRLEIEKNWTCKGQSEKYRKLFDKVLENIYGF